MEDDKKIPTCIGIIMDGNRRWAKEQGLPTLEGHLKGYQKFKEVVEWAGDAGVKNIICYAFSTENWNRTEEEVSYLMNLMKKALIEDAQELIEKEVRVRVLGQVERLNKDLQEGIHDLEERSKDNTKITAGLAISYGGRPDIVQAVNALIKEGKQEITEDDISSHLWTHDMPDPDIILRPGGERRLSNFLTWQSSYSELFFIDTYWPEFSKENFGAILSEYANRERRRGK